MLVPFTVVDVEPLVTVSESENNAVDGIVNQAHRAESLT